MLILNFKAFIDRNAPMYLCEPIEQQTSSTNTRLADDAFLLKVPPPSRSFIYGSPYEWNKLDERVRRLTNFTMFESKFKRCYFYVI